MSLLHNVLIKRKAFVMLLFICLYCASVFSQEKDIEDDAINLPKKTEEKIEIDVLNNIKIDETQVLSKPIKLKTEFFIDNKNPFNKLPRQKKYFAETKSKIDDFYKNQIEQISLEQIKDEPPFKIPKIRFSTEPKEFKKPQVSEKFHWKPAVAQSLYFLGIQQGFRMMQKKTTRELDGKFFADWGKSVRNLGGWRDGDSFMTNYIAHPMQGAVTGRIFINNSDKSKKLEFKMSKDYWKSRVKTMVWSAVWSTQFELGPISEATIGNVGLYDRTGPNRMGWVDIVVTPTAGTGVIIGEDLVDKFILKKWLEKRSSRTRIKIFRTFFTPFQSFTNILRWKAPWKRDNR